LGPAKLRNNQQSRASRFNQMRQITKLIITCLLVALCGLTAQAAGVLENDPALVLHFDFETQPTNGTVVDTSGYGNDGFQFNTTNYLTYTNGIFGGTAAQSTFVGGFGTVTPLSQYIAVTNLQGLLSMTNATFSVWLQFAPNTNNSVVSIVDCGYNYSLLSNSFQFPSGSNSWSFGRYGNFENYLRFWVYPASGGALKILQWPNNDGPSFMTTRMHLYTATIDCTSNMATAYFDGVPFTNGPVGVPSLRVYGCKALRWVCVGAFCHNGTPQWGDDSYPNDGYFAGRMDDLRIYNRTLSATEVKALYQTARSVTLTATAAQQVQLSWRGQSAVTYQPETCADLSSQVWASLGSPIVSTGSVDTVTNVPTSSAFYRVRAVSP
jgi:hypothetical protein